MLITVDIPDEIEQEVSFTFTGRALEHQKKTAVAAAMTQAASTIERQQATMTENEAVYAKQVHTLNEALATNREQSAMLKQANALMDIQAAEIAALKTQIAELEKLGEMAEDTPEDFYGETHVYVTKTDPLTATQEAAAIDAKC